MPKRIYVESFDAGTQGWFGWTSNTEGPKPLEVRDGAVITRSPWWIDYNHAPPGAGYLHMLFCLNTAGSLSHTELYIERAGHNRFVEEKYPTDFRGAKLTFRMKGELESRGANLALLVQGGLGGVISGWVLVGQPLTVTPDWSEQTLNVIPDAKLWRCLGARWDRTVTYGEVDLATVIGNVTANILLILFPLEVVPMGPVAGDPNKLRAGKDYPVWQSRLPEGYVMLDKVRIEFKGE